MTTDILTLYQAEGHQAAKKNAKEWAGPCPACGGNDRFNMFMEQGRDGLGRYWCRGCEIKGDAIEFLRLFKGMTFPDACRELGIALRQRSGTSGSRNRDKRPVRLLQTRQWEPRETPLPSAKWQAKALKLVSWAQGQLSKQPYVLEWLEQERGLTSETVRRLRLGWIPEPLWRDRLSWGLPRETKKNGKPKKLWIPSGLAIPVFDEQGRIRRIKIRLADPGDKLPKYLPIPNDPKDANTAPLIIRTGAQAWAILESELDAILLAQEAESLVNVAALGSASYRPDTGLYTQLQAAPFILCCLDHDDAGYKNAFQWWEKQFPFEQFRPWPVPEGKDICDAWKAGWPLSAWITGGLPPALLPRESAQQTDKGPGKQNPPPGLDSSSTEPTSIPADKRKHTGQDQPESNVIELYIMDQASRPTFGIVPERDGQLYDIPRAETPRFMKPGPEDSYQELREVCDYVEKHSGYRPQLYVDNLDTNLGLALRAPINFDARTIEHAAEQLRQCAGLVRDIFNIPGPEGE